MQALAGATPNFGTVDTDGINLVYVVPFKHATGSSEAPFTLVSVMFDQAS